MEQSRQALRSLLIPYQGGRAIIPNSIVAQVLPFATPLHIENAPPWVVGAMLWRARTSPLVSLGRLICGVDTEPQDYVHSRIVVVNALGGDPRLINFGFLATDVPHLLNSLERDEITLDEETTAPAPPGVLSRVRVKEEAAIIPDMDAIEAVLGELVRT